MQNSKETWLQIGEIFNLGKRKTHGAETVSTEQFYKYFKQQNATPLNNILDPETNMETHSNDEEIEAAINKMKANKSPGFDNILNEVIKSDLVSLFHRILDTGKYLALWSFGLIVPIDKKDDPTLKITEVSLCFLR